MLENEMNKKVEEIKEEFRNNLVDVDFDIIKCRSKDYLAKYFFGITNVNKKFMDIVHRYDKILEWNMLYSICTEIALKTINNFVINDKDKPYIKTDDDIRKKMTTAIVFNMDKQINNYIDKWTGAYRTREGGEDVIHSVLPSASFDFQAEKEELNEEFFKYKLELSAQQKEQYGKWCTNTKSYFLDTEDPETQKTMEFFFSNEKTPNRQLEYIADLIENNATKKQKEVFDVLVQAEGNQEYASEILGCSQQNVSKVQNNLVKRIDCKIESVYANKRKETIKILENFIDNIEDEEDVIKFILDNQDEEFILYLLYDSDIDIELVQYFNLNKDNKDKNIHTETMKKFCTYFIKETYIYIELLKYNDSIELEPVKATETIDMSGYKEFIQNSKVKKYLRWDRLPNNERKGEYIVIDGEKYYLMDEYKAKDIETKIKYTKGA